MKYQILVVGIDDAGEKGVLGQIEMVRAPDFEPGLQSYEAWISKWGRPKHPWKRGTVKYNSRKNSWELVWEAVSLFCKPDEAQEAEDRAKEKAQEREGEGVTERAEGPKDAGS